MACKDNQQRDFKPEDSSNAHFSTAKPDDVQLDVHSPAKNRYTGAPLRSKKSNAWPILFERAARTWWNPKFNSDCLEEQLWKSYFPQTRRRFQYALVYIIVACVAWCVFFGTTKQENWDVFLGGALALLCVIGLVFLFTYTRFYERVSLITSVFVSATLCAMLLAQFAYDIPEDVQDISSVGTFAGSIEVLLLMYTVIPMPLYMSVILGVLYSVLYEVLWGISNTDIISNQPAFIVSKILLHLCIHTIGIHIFIMSQVRRHSTFWKIGLSVMARRDLLIEKQIKEQMINSLMPAFVSNAVMSDHKKTDDDNDDKMNPQRKLIFRSFQMNKMDNVSILFADIVGFTKMSSNKTAEHLVSLLNLLFGRFDVICEKSNCEKISTLGDCYYCVSGCPEKRDDHAKCCVEMGLSMIQAIKEFDREYKEQVNMRVGVHTGTVLCGLVGTRRFKFDVWSNDVTLANTMESSGRPGMVHISDTSYQFLKDDYEVEPGEDCEDNRAEKKLIEYYHAKTSQYEVKHKENTMVIKTYFITGRRERDEDGNEIIRKAPTPTISEVDIPAAVAKEKEESAPAQEHLSDNEDVEKAQGDNQQTEGVANGLGTAALLGRRHSKGFYTTSQLSLDRIDEKELESSDPSTEPINKKWNMMRQIQKQNDQQIIKCVREDVTDKEYFYKPPINRFTLKFQSSDLENSFRCHYVDDAHGQNMKTLGAPGYHSLLEIFISLIIFILISICCIIVFDRSVQWAIIFVVSLIIEVLAIFLIITDIKCRKWKQQNFYKLTRFTTGWYFRNITGCILAGLPVVQVYSNFLCDSFPEMVWRDRFFCYCIVVALLHFCNFTMLSSWMKSVLAALAGIALVLLFVTGICDVSYPVANIFNVDYNSTSNSTLHTNASGYSVYTSPSALSLANTNLFSGRRDVLSVEIILDVILLLILIWFLNREFEISYRLSFHGDIQAENAKKQMQENKEQAEWLLHNIIPAHVSEILKKTSKYSKNHKDIGVIFATIVNFNEFYDESFEGGKENLRILNELFSDYEELLDEERFKDVEKIKTISSTFMAASGLNEQRRSENNHKYAHLCALMDFAVEMLRVVQQFNESMINFEFVLNVGFNFGEVTAGVIGTTKLLYDIWGDTVNISSRMYSTGVNGKIQVPERVAQALDQYFEFEYRDTISVKGKGEMKTYLLVKKRDDAYWD